MTTREINNIIAIGTIVDVKPDGAAARIQIGEITTDYLPLPAAYGVNYRAATPPIIGAQMVVASPSGNLDAGVIIGQLWRDTTPPFTTAMNIVGMKFEDGTFVVYDTQTHNLNIDAVGDVNIKSQSTLTLEAAAIKIKGDVEQLLGDIVSDGKSLQHHKHVETGSVTQGPQ